MPGPLNVTHFNTIFFHHDLNSALQFNNEDFCNVIRG